MTRRQAGRHAETAGRIAVSGSERQQLEGNTDDAVDVGVDVSASTDCQIISNVYPERDLIVIPA